MGQDKKFTKEQLEAAQREFRAMQGGVPDLPQSGDPNAPDFLNRVESVTGNPWVQGSLLAGTVLSGGTLGIAFGAADAIAGGISTVNRLREGDYGNAAISGVGTALGAQAAARGIRDVRRASRIASTLPEEAQAAARARGKLTPSTLMSPELRKAARMVQERLASRAATTAAAETAAQRTTIVKSAADRLREQIAARAAAAKKPPVVKPAAAAAAKPAAVKPSAAAKPIPSTTLPLSYQSTMDTLARLRRMNPEMSEGIDLIEARLNEPRVRSRTETPRPSRSAEAVAARPPVVTRTTEELKDAIRASMRGETPAPPAGPPPPVTLKEQLEASIRQQEGKPPVAPPKRTPLSKRDAVMLKKQLEKFYDTQTVVDAAADVAQDPTAGGGVAGAPAVPSAASSAIAKELARLKDRANRLTVGIARGNATARGRATLQARLDAVNARVKAIEGGTPPPVGEPPAVTAAMNAIADRASVGSTAPPITSSAYVPPELSALKNRRSALMAEVRAQRVKVNALPKGSQGHDVATLKLKSLTKDLELMNKDIAARGTPPPGGEPPAAPAAVVGGGSGPRTPPPAIGTRAERLASIRNQFGGAQRRQRIASQPTPAAPSQASSLAMSTEGAGAVPPPRSPVVVPEVPVAAASAVVPPVRPPALTPPEAAIELAKKKLVGLKHLEQQLRAAGPSLNRDRALATTAAEIKALNDRITRLGQLPSAAPRMPSVDLPVVDVLPGATKPKLTRKINRSLTAEEAGELHPVPNRPTSRTPWLEPGERDAARSSAARAPLTQRNPRQPKPAAPAAAAAPAAPTDPGEINQAIRRAIERLEARTKAPTTPGTGRLKVAAAVTRKRIPDVVPGLKKEVTAVADALDKAAADAEAAAAKKAKAPRLVKKDGSRLPPREGGAGWTPTGDGELGATAGDLMDLLGKISGAAMGSAAGAHYGAGQAPEGEDKTKYAAAGAGTGALLGLLGSHAAIRKLRGDSLANMAKKYQYFSLLSDPGALGRATMGSMRSILAGVGQRVAEGRFSDVSLGLKQLTKDNVLKYFQILTAKDQSVHLPAAVRAGYRRAGRASAAPGYKVTDLPGRVISAGDIASTRVLHKMGFSAEEIARMNLGGDPQTRLGRTVLSGLGEDVHYKALNKKGQVVTRKLKGRTSPGGDLVRRALIPFARMTVALPERTIAYMPGINMLPAARRAFSEVPGQMLPMSTAIGRSAMGVGAIGEGYFGSAYTEPHTDPWLVAAGGPMAGLTGIGVALRRMQEKDQHPGSFVMQQLQNLVPGVSEQLSPQFEKLIPSVFKSVAKGMDPAYDRLKGATQLENERTRRGEATSGPMNYPGELSEMFLGNIKARVPVLRETLPEAYRPADKWGQPLYPDRPSFIPDVTLRGEFPYVNIVAPKALTSGASIDSPKWPVKDPTSQYLRQLEKETGQTIMSPPSQPLEDKELTEMARIQGRVPPRIHRDTKEVMQLVRGMAPRREIIAMIDSPAFRSRPKQEQAMLLREAVQRNRLEASEGMTGAAQASMVSPAIRAQILRGLQTYARALQGPR